VPLATRSTLLKEHMSILENAATRLGDTSTALAAAATVLVIDDEPAVCTTLRYMLKADGHAVVTAASGKEGVGQLHRQHFDLAIVDLLMPEMNGLQTMAALKELDPELEVIFLTGFASVETSVAALKQGACDYLLKPFTMMRVRSAIARALDLRRRNSHRETLQNAQKLARLVEELAQERDLLRILMDNLPDAIYIKDSECRFTRINAAHARLLGVADSSEAIGKTDLDFFPREDAQRFVATERNIIETGRPLIGNLDRIPDATGKPRWISNTEVPVKDAQGRVTGIVGVARDVTELKATVQELRDREERYRELFENANDVIYTTDLEARITSLNRAGEQILGYTDEEAIQTDLWHLVVPKHWDRVKRCHAQLLAGESGVRLEIELTAKDGRLVMMEANPRLIFKDRRPVGVQAIGRDITGRDAAEVELRHTQKMESVGRLASGIAHEINTPIQFVGDNTRFLQESFESFQSILSKYQELRSALASGTANPELLAEVQRVEEESDCAYLMGEVPQALTQTLEGVDRVATIVRAMKEFAHPEAKEMAATDLNRALQSTLTVARNEWKYVADVETDFGDLPLVVCIVGDLNQVFLNLLVNAAHAINEVVKGTFEKGKIRVRTRAEGTTVLVTISDTGCGIPEANRTKVFDPFFTTKEVGRGTGQGLAISRSVVVDRHKGTLTFESELGKGTTFYVRLPLDPAESSQEIKAP
jgi:PAS domain S-box-containing protein